MSFKIKKILCMFLMFAFSFTFTGCQDENEQSGGYDGKVFDISLKQDNSVTASINKEGTSYELTISGVGSVKDYDKKESVPWNAISKKIKEVTIEEGISNIGNYYFYSLNLDNYFIPSTVIEISENSFNANATIYSYSQEQITNNSENKIYYYSVEAPSVSGEYWHMIGENPVVWDTYKIMFIGNSFTFYPSDVFSVENPGVCALTKALADDLGLAVTIDFVVKGAHSLNKFANEKDEYGAIVDEKLKSANDYDYIILQEHSTTPVNDYNSFSAGVTALVNKINATQEDCEVILYATWGFPSGVSSSGVFSSVSVMEGLIRDAYIRCAQENSLRVSHVGEAFTYVYENHKDINLYGKDDKHQSYAGAYLSACVHLATIFGVDVRSANFTGDLDNKTATTLQEVAYNTVFN